jgi:hypothetical protein
MFISAELTTIHDVKQLTFYNLIICAMKNLFSAHPNCARDLS